MVRIAIIGAGFMGGTHAQAYQHIPNAEVVAVCDQNEIAGKTLAFRLNCAYYADCEEMLKDAAFDVADVCLPTFLHEEYVLLAARYRKHILCEKPVTLTLPSLDRMIAAANRSGVRLMVGQVMRFWPEYHRAKSMYVSGEFGAIKAVHADRLSVHPQWSEWYRRPENSGGGLFDLHLHDIDFLCYLLGTVHSVYAVGQKNSYGCYNHVVTTLNFENGVSASAEGILEMTDGYPFTMSLRVVGENKTLEYHMEAGKNLENREGAIREARIYSRNEEPEFLNADNEDAYETELRYFVHCLDMGIEPSVILPEDARQVLRTILAIQESMETNREVCLSPDNACHQAS